jgi:hypothetical protein
LGKHLEVFQRTPCTTINSEHIGKTSDELVAQWNGDNPADLVEYESKRSEAPLRQCFALLF